MFDRCIRAQAKERPDAPAVITVNGALSFQRLDALVDRTALELKHIVPAEEEPVRVDTADEHLHWVISLALARLGIASSPASDKGCSIVVSDTSASGPTHVLDAGALQRIFEGGTVEPPVVDPLGKDLGRVIRSSGTTGEAKRIGLSWEVIDARVRNALADYGPFDGTCLIDPGINTALGFIVTLAAWTSGSAVIWGCTLDEPSKVAYLRPSLLSAVPYRLQLFIDALPCDYPMWPLRIISGGGPISQALSSSISGRLTSKVTNIYGSSEAGAIAIADLPTIAHAERAAGYILPNVEVEVVAPDGTPRPRGELGELRVRGEKVARSYLPPNEADACFRDGWYYTRDLARLGAEGLLLVEGRVDDVMNLGGIKVLPLWIEEAALGCPGVIDAAAFSSSDTGSANSCYLAIVGSAEYEQRSLERFISVPLQHLNELRILTVSSIPRNAMGKIDRLALRELARNIRFVA
jgi:acyl-coenzyme A synthetase/AMP-(fatty) acid ligase